MVSQDHQEQVDLLAQVDLPDQAVHPAQVDQVVHQVQADLLVQVDLLDHPVHQVVQDQVVLQVHPVILA